MKPLPVFLAVAFVLSWLVALPLWLGGGLGHPLMPVFGMLMMFTPTLGVLAAWRASRVPFREWARETGLTLGERKGRTLLLVLAAWLGVPALVALAAALSVAAGLLTLDLDGLGLYRAQLEAQNVPVPAGLATGVVIQFVIGVVAGPLLNALPSLGEEWGWRGYLVPRLTGTCGVVAGLMLSGAIWGLWHAPLTLLGYNYPNLGAGAALYFTGFCVVAGVVLGWLRLRSGSVWPAVVAHGSLNATAGVVLLLGDVAEPPNLALAGLTGLVGWVLLAILGAVLLRIFPVRAPSADRLAGRQTTST
ncbi:MULTISPECIES: CPBP family intramembrane glutamic endopeptidase [Nonomuraea]|uniref:CPBP family intramembrane metalloprotease n=1 Tax=Nonomuraea ferruginea TaxID=46174 RepID=A0ABT4TBE8_9ACTN|nr:CPBP family intramembrane glutamic endopeptidase [Nonomuraea ferruginea]MDA0646816.1 CPBP family intramembrane metalloprotease [Nonomuraea ferruginea]